jgi:hypothetical protein
VALAPLFLYIIKYATIAILYYNLGYVLFVIGCKAQEED